MDRLNGKHPWILLPAVTSNFPKLNFEFLIISFGYLKLVNCLIIYVKKLLDSDCLRAVQFKCNTSVKNVTLVQKV